MRLLPLIIVSALTSGCGLVLDLEPPDDASVLRDAGSYDAGQPRECTVDSECDDQNACNGLETCAGGMCAAGAPVACADEIDCTDDSCDSVTGECVHTPNDTRCPDDSVECTVERCDASSGCFPELHHEICDDTIFCTVDSCDVEIGCGNVPDHTRCGGTAALCNPDTGGCPVETCETVANCRAPGQCATVACIGNVCTRTNMANETSCTDDNPCTAESTCQAGECRGVESPRCEGQPCIACNPEANGCDGSLPAPTTAPCEDGDHCTTGDRCVGTVCEGSNTTICDPDPTLCVIEECDSSSGACAPSGLRTSGGCNDNSVCTTNDACTSTGMCEGAPGNDGMACGIDSSCRGGDCVPNGTMCDVTTQIACPVGCCPGGLTGYCGSGGGCADCAATQYACRCDATLNICRSRGDTSCPCRPTTCALRGMQCSDGQQCCECAAPDVPICLPIGSPCPCTTIS